MALCKMMIVKSLKSKVQEVKHPSYMFDNLMILNTLCFLFDILMYRIQINKHHFTMMP